MQMLVLLRKIVAIIALAACLVGPFGVAIWKTSHTPNSPQHLGKEKNAAKENPEDAIARYNYWLTWVIFILAVATIGLGGIGIFQIRLARAEFLSTHRPKIRIKHVVLKKDIWQRQPIIVDITCVNSGTSPAFLREIGVDYFIVKKQRPLPIKTDIKAIGNFGRQALPVGLNCPFPNIDLNRVLTAQEGADLRDGQSKLYCVDWISYFDGRGYLRIKGFCRVLTYSLSGHEIENCRFRKFDDPDYEYED